VVQCWPEVVGPIVAAQTRPLNLYRGVLKVATSSAAWSQNLVFERQRIITKLNQIAALTVTDIRFSPAQWHYTPTTSFPGEQFQQELWQSHPSRTGDPPRRLARPKIDGEHGATPLSAFQEWAQIMRSRSRQFPLCPQCQCPTPVGELERWQVCAICAAKQWS
jgi:predicted nucleic acid-binding Zn ribbon protein